ncbi:plant virulence effector HPE1-like domain-containing protein [Hoeflea ulvae]|uniref:Plant virulence effector HPE1-like domain-containing protein n=1 Tax=Hoeflea ulvae TaxID=2983764 RepID=A0ABT3YE09_9HYPH|nr:plant virulence effector HPE1-like domain-containing protein [Hoeflea ulvae]MCY0094126.1 plant virulence effector HPE1-like domain-containing protein [Hoeflea ulvae]
MMRLIIAATISAGAGAANAGSIEQFAATTSTRTSIVEIGCPSCARIAAEKAEAEAEIKLAPGEQIIEVRDVDGEKMIYRTENWLGGSPVTMVSKATELDLIALGITPAAPATADTAPTAVADTAVTEAPAETGSEPALFEPVIANTAPGIDKDTKTSALGAPPAEPFDPSKMQLRLN